MTEEAGYQALYRKYRPQAPDEVVGQEHVVRALVGAIEENRLAHAFLFCGPRGTGKTSTARILAKMVNCDRGPTAEPCGVCDQCVRIRDGTHLDVVEIDAASHGGVEDARELRERAPTAPAMGREKIYILDEAQRLSREAFDALLKLFEEPPPAVRFVLATTEPHKMPPTIVGRCQRFDFRRLATDDLASLLQAIATREGIDLDRSAAEAFARQAEGSARDAESLLDQAAVLGGGSVTMETVASLLGSPADEVAFELADAIAVGDGGEIFRVVHDLVQGGHDLRHFTGQALAHFRDLMLVQAAPAATLVIDAPPERHRQLAAQAAKFTPAELGRVVSLLLDAQADLRWTTSPRLTLELALVRATVPEADPSPAGLAARVERLERLAGVVETPAPPREQAPAPGPDTPVPHADASEPAEPALPVEPAGQDTGVAETPPAAAAAEPPAPAAHAPSTEALDIVSIRRGWPQLLEHLQRQRQMILQANLASATAASFDGEILELAFPPGRKFGVEKVQAREADLQQAFAQVFGVAPRIVCVLRDGEPAPVDVPAEDDPPLAAGDAVARFAAEFGARPDEEAGGP